MSEYLDKIRRGLKKPPKIILKRASQEIAGEFARYWAPYRARRFTLANLLRKTEQSSLANLWDFLSKRPYCTPSNFIDPSFFETLCPNEANLIFARAQRAMDHQVNLLGSGLIALGNTINWHADYKTQVEWPQIYMRDIDYNNPERPSDVKFPWELSRVQWLIPLGQAYLLTKDEMYAEKVKWILSDWIENNRYATGVNWACTMEVALRILTWTWLFHIFNKSAAWHEDATFQQKWLTYLYLHAEFTERHIEYSDINGNHCTADAAGLVFAGLFFGNGENPSRWLEKGWKILCQELPRQVFADGVNFEASIPYHRLVLELFFFPARYRECQGLMTPTAYRERLCKMAYYTAAYTQPKGEVPWWGDADDARALPFGSQAVNDHRYLCGLIGFQWGENNLIAMAPFQAEHFWLLGPKASASFAKEKKPAIQSCAFSEGGFYIMRNEQDHVFIDCGPIGLAGRGGHGHNDCLSFEAVLKGVKLISDCGAFVYTASYKDRNLFRATAAHNTPCVDGEEINRFLRWDYLWTMHNDAKPVVEAWKPGSVYDYFQGIHLGYQRLNDPVTPRRILKLHHRSHSLLIQDEIVCQDSHTVNIPLHLAPEVVPTLLPNNKVRLQTSEQSFHLYWKENKVWRLDILPARLSPSYGVIIPSYKLVWSAKINKTEQLKIIIKPSN